MSADAPPEEMIVPDFLKPLGHVLQRDPPDNLECACAYLNMPLPDQCPSPGDAKGYEAKDFEALANKLGLKLDREAAHSWIWRHAEIQSVILSCSKTPGDIRSAMAAARQFRNRVRKVASRANNLLRMYAIGGIPPDMKSLMDPDGFRKHLIADVQADGAEEFEAASTYGAHRYSEGSKTVGDLLNLLRAIQVRFKIPQTRVLADLLDDFDNGEKEWDRLRLLPQERPASAVLAADIQDYLRNLEAEADDLADKRAAKHPAPVPHQKSPREILTDTLKARDGGLLRDLKGVLAAVISTSDRLRLLEGRLQHTPEIPDLGDTEPLKARIAELEAKLDAASKERDEDTADLDHLNGEIKALGQAKKDLLALAGLVVDTLKAIQSQNSFQMVRSLEELSNQAQAYIPKGNP
jgi:hypothetical protein